MVICQECRFGQPFVQSDLCIVFLLNCEAVVVKSFLLVNFLEQSRVLTTTLIV